MTQVNFKKSLLCGELVVPPSKSAAHRAIIGAALSNGQSTVENLSDSVDVITTVNALKAMGANITLKGNKLTANGFTPNKNVTINCEESGSTLRFLIPVCAALGINAAFTGKGKLPTRPITPYLTGLKGVNFNYRGTMPFSISGKLKSGDYYIDGDISSQFVTGLLFALPLIEGNSRIIINGKLHSKPYVDITLNVLNKFNITPKQTDYGYEIIGSQKYTPADICVEGDFSQAAFFAAANALGSNVNIKGLDLGEVSSQLQGYVTEYFKDQTNTPRLDECLFTESYLFDFEEIQHLLPTEYHKFFKPTDKFNGASGYLEFDSESEPDGTCEYILSLLSNEDYSKALFLLLQEIDNTTNEEKVVILKDFLCFCVPD